MSDDLDALLRDHYRRAAEGVQPDRELIDRLRNTARPARAVAGWPRALLAAAAVAAIALLAWGLLRPDHAAEPSRRSVPIAPLPATTEPPSHHLPTPTPTRTKAHPVSRPPKRGPRPPSAPPTPRPTLTRNWTPRPAPTGTPSSIPRPSRR
ncbi:hypothetical protein [Actinoallomurus rhizosphaericola]|uniref:hypothetical protein n=1 Tax=Actinoallomurus rhizosphaericola TaxID=2952536 RepID=UPI002090F1C5|nr:hypothetical protein [Actinoallomurus rhizosphaericola]MCO5994041.1 hypothetical protein [Actinoallomurus rhizosphaericola]